MPDLNIYTSYDPSLPLTADDLMKMPHDVIFAKGELPDSPEGINMTGSGRMLRWLAKKGGGNDWAIYCYWADQGAEFMGRAVSWEYIKTNGDKVTNDRNIRKCINVADDAMKLYRK